MDGLEGNIKFLLTMDEAWTRQDSKTEGATRINVFFRVCVNFSLAERHPPHTHTPHSVHITHQERPKIHNSIFDQRTFKTKHSFYKMPPTHKATPTLTTSKKKLPVDSSTSELAPLFVDSKTSDIAPALTALMPLSVDSTTFGLHSSNIPKTHKILYPLKQVPGEHTKWAGMAPLEMIAYIMSLAEGSMQTFLSDEPNHSTAQQIGAKRKRDCTEEDEDEIFENVRFADDEADAVVMTCMRPVDDSFRTWTPSSYVGESSHSVNLNLLIGEFERVAVDPIKKWCLPSYNRVQQAFYSKVGAAGGNEKFDLAVSEASTQMKALIEMASHDIKEASKPSFSPKIAAASHLMAKSAAEKFQHTMNFWVKHNWRNP